MSILGIAAIVIGIVSFIGAIAMFSIGGDAGIFFLIISVICVIIVIAWRNGVKKAKEKNKKIAEETERFNKLPLEEQDRIRSAKIPWEISHCSGCRAKLCYYEKGRMESKWKLVKTENKKTTVFDSAYRLGAYGTVNLKEKIITVKHYKCPKCGYERIEEN